MKQLCANVDPSDVRQNSLHTASDWPPLDDSYSDDTSLPMVSGSFPDEEETSQLPAATEEEGTQPETGCTSRTQHQILASPRSDVITATSRTQYRLLKLMLKKHNIIKSASEFEATFDCKDSARTITVSCRDAAGVAKVCDELKQFSEQRVCTRSFDVPFSDDMESWVERILKEERILEEARLPAVLTATQGAAQIASFDQTTADRALKVIGERLLVGKVRFEQHSKTAVDRHLMTGHAGGNFLDDVKRGKAVTVTRKDDHIEVYGLPSDVIKVVGEVEDRLLSR